MENPIVGNTTVNAAANEAGNLTANEPGTAAPAHPGSFEPCTKVQQYIDINRLAIRRWFSLMGEAYLRKIMAFLDIATGIGTMTELFIKEFPDGTLLPHIYALDKSPEALDLASAHLRLWPGLFTPILGSAESIWLPSRDIDIVIWGNGIHYLNEEHMVPTLKRIKSCMKSGGWFCFNSTFYGGVKTKETYSFYLAQLVESLRIIRAQGIKREKGERTEASKYHEVNFYRQVTEEAGFTIVDVHEEVVPSSYEFWHALCGYHQYAAGALIGYPVAEAAKALQEGVKIALDKHGLLDAEGHRYIPRPWLMVAARA